MDELKSYGDAVVYTLRTQAVRSAILIDDAFPSFRDLLSADSNEKDAKIRYPDWLEARDLYELFHRNRIVCDVENRIQDRGDDFIEKIRKSDLVVLDWNLKRDDHDNCDDATAILRTLSTSKHFNLVVVYTHAPDLKRVWTRAAVHLRGGWKRKEAFAELSKSQIDADQLFYELDEERAEESVTDEIFEKYVVDGRRALGSDPVKPLMALMARHDVEPKYHAEFTEALIHRAAAKAHGAKSDDGNEVLAIEGERTSETPYIACGSVFVAFMRKPDAGEAPRQSIFDCLDGALKAWNPGLLQLLVSELQNELERNSYAFDHALVGSDALKAGWLYHTLKIYAEADGRDEALDAVAAGLNSRIIEAVDNAISGHMSNPRSSLRKFGRKAAHLAIGEFDHNMPEGDLANKAKELARVEKREPHDILHALNEYLSSDAFRGGYVSTGTVLCSADRRQWFLCISPACDMVPRPPNDPMSWHADLYPFRPINLLKLETCAQAGALANAEHGVQIFVTVGNCRYFLRAIHHETRLPRPKTCFLGNGTPSTPAQSEPWQRHAFQIFDIVHNNGRAETNELCLFAVAQLRPAYAARFQQLNGAHQSRVGVDFVKFGA